MEKHSKNKSNFIKTDFNSFINEQEKSNFKFDYKGTEIHIEHIHGHSYRLIDRKTRTWTIIKSPNMEVAIKRAKDVLDVLFANGRPNFLPKGGEKFVITGEYYNWETDEIKETDGLWFTTGAHSRNIGGTGKKFVKKGGILTFDVQGEDNGFWYADGDKEVDRSSYFLYTDGSKRERLKGPKPWSLIWRKEIEQIS